MVSLRGIPTRGNSQVRKLNRDLESNKLGRELYNSVLRGDSITAITASLKAAGVNTTRLTLERSLFKRYNIEAIARYYDRASSRYGVRSGFSSNRLARMQASNIIKVKLIGTTKSGEIYKFDTFVRVGDSESLSDVLKKLREIYEDDNGTNKSPLKDLKFR